MPCELSVNLNAVAMLRNRRDLPWPSVVELGRIALEAGCGGLTVHPRPDERHIKASDCHDLIALVRDYPGKEFNMEGYPEERFLSLVEAVKPDQVTLVPDDPAQPTSDHGWDCVAHAELLTTVNNRLHDGGFRVSLFIDADPAAPEQAKATGADRVELYTGPYGHTFEQQAKQSELDKLVATGKAAKALGLGLNAGHDLTLENIPPLVAALDSIDEMSIGHALTADCLTHGMAETVRLYRKAMGQAA